MHEIGIEWMTQTEVNGHFLELRGIPDERLKWERIPEAIAGANYYNIQNIPGQLTVEPDSGKIYLKIQYVTGADIRETTIMDALVRYLETEMMKICQWVTLLNQTEKVIGSQWLLQAAGKICYSVEDKFLMACEMEEKLMAVLDTYTIPYMADSECMGVCCEWHRESQSHMYHITIQSAEMMMTISTVLSTPVPEEQIPDTLETCMALNQGAWGSFYLDDSTGCVGYHMTAVYGRHVDTDWITAQIALAEAAIGDWKKKEDDWRAQER